MASSELLLVWTGTAALACSYLTISRRFDEILGGAFSLVLWGVFSFNALNVQFWPDGATSPETEAYRSIAFLGLAGGIVMLYFLLQAFVGSLDPAESTRYGDDTRPMRHQ